MLSAASRKILAKPLEVILEAARLTKWDEFKFQQSMYILLFDCLVDASAWEVGVKQVECSVQGFAKHRAQATVGVQGDVHVNSRAERRRRIGHHLGV